VRYQLSALIAALVLAALPGTARGQAPAEPEDSQAAAAAPEQEPWRAVRFGVTLEAYYEFNFNEPPNRVSLLRAYDTRANTFAIQQATALAELAPDVEAGRRYGLRVDLMYGQATETVQGSPANEPRPEVYRQIWQAYGSYVFPVGRGLRTDFGKFASNLGYETNYAKDNDQFSRAYLFNFLPFYHSGLRASLPVHDKVTLMYMLTNGIQQTEEFNNFKSNHFSAVVTPLPNVSWTTNYYFGQEQPDGGEPDGPDGFFHVLDSYVAWTPTDRVGFGFDVNHVTNDVRKDEDSVSLDGFGVYARYKLAPPATVAVRYERLDDAGLFGGIDQELQEVTLTGEWKFAEGFLVRGEFRRDWSSEPFFTGSRGADDLKDGQSTALIGLVWWIGNKTGVW
jgi:hypothetical protein